MSATNQALIGRYPGASLLAAFGPNGSQADILQIGGGPNNSPEFTIYVSVDYTGAVHFNSSGLTPTNGKGGNGLYTTQGTLVGRFPLAGINLFPSSVAQVFAEAFPNNPSNLDIIQIVNQGGNISYWLDSTGVAHGS